MAIDNQFFVGTLVFGGLAYYLFSQKDKPTESERESGEKTRVKHEIYEELDLLKDRLDTFTTNDQKKGRNKNITPLAKHENDGLVEIVTRLKELDKKQSKTQALGRHKAIQLHNEITELDGRARHYIDRYAQQSGNQDVDIRQVARNIAAAENLITPGGSHQRYLEATARGMRSHSRLSVSASPATFVKDPPTLTSRNRPAKKRKPSFVQNNRPAEVFDQQEGSDNTTHDARSKSAFETNVPRDDTHTHAKNDADMEESRASGAHGKDGQHIRPVTSKSMSTSQSDNVEFNQSPGPVDDNRDRVQRSEGRSRSTEVSRTAVIDLEVSEQADEAMDAELATKMEELGNGEIRLTEALDKKLRAINAQINFDDYKQGDAFKKALDEYRRRDMGGGGIIANIGHPNDPLPRRKNKRPLSQVSHERGPEKLTVTETQTGQRIKISRGSGFLGQRDPVPPPSRSQSAAEVGYVNPRSTRGLPSPERAQLYQEQQALLKDVEKGGGL